MHSETAANPFLTLRASSSTDNLATAAANHAARESPAISHPFRSRQVNRVSFDKAAAFQKHPDLLRGRLSNTQFADLLKHYESEMAGASLIVDVESAPNYAPEKSKWSKQAGPSMQVTPGIVKVLSFTITEPSGKELGRHFIILKSQKENEIVAIDPGNPLTDRRYLVELKKDPKDGYARVYLNQPPDLQPRPNVHELNTVFKVAVIPRSQNGPRPCDDTTVEEIKTAINKTASEFQNTEKFLSPRAWREKTASVGLPGLDLPLEVGGSNWPASKMLEMFRHAGWHNLNFRDVVGGAHVRPLLHSQSPKVHEIVKQVASGKGYMAIAITEPEAGSDVAAIRSTARKVEGGYLLSGEKRFNARLDQATHVIVFTQGTTGKQGKLSVFVLPINTPGLKKITLEAHA